MAPRNHGHGPKEPWPWFLGTMARLFDGSPVGTRVAATAAKAGGHKGSGHGGHGRWYDRRSASNASTLVAYTISAGPSRAGAAAAGAVACTPQTGAGGKMGNRVAPGIVVNIIAIAPVILIVMVFAIFIAVVHVCA